MTNDVRMRGFRERAEVGAVDIQYVILMTNTVSSQARYRFQ